jgi:hypothetical protein
MYRKGGRERESLATLPSAAALYPIVGRCVQKAIAGFRRLYDYTSTHVINNYKLVWLAALLAPPFRRVHIPKRFAISSRPIEIHKRSSQPREK